MIKIKRACCNFEREALQSPFGFKGGYIHELWQVAALLEAQSGLKEVGLGTQSILWSDSQVFFRYSHPASNAMMFLLTEYALQKALDIPFATPMDLLEELFPPVYDYGKIITGNSQLRETFALNALVAVDNAAWLLYCGEKGITDFDRMIPDNMLPALSHRNGNLAAIPLISYEVSTNDIDRILNEGFFFLKIKIGSDPNRDGDPDKMLEWDKKRISSIHETAKDRYTPYTDNGKIPYYLDANGRYDSVERLLRLLDYADHIGALDRIILLEEPFHEKYKPDVHKIPVRLVADESAHSDRDALERIEMGYGAIALKPVAKTMSMSLKILQVAHKNNVPCFCADLTVNPILVEWNKNVAARMAPLPGMKIGILESNGHQNYLRWDIMQSYHPYIGSTWISPRRGLFILDEEFYKLSGGMFMQSEHYKSLIFR